MEKATKKARYKFYRRCFSTENNAMAKNHQVVKSVESDDTTEREDNMKLDTKLESK